MNTLECLAVAVALAMDAFAVAIATGIRLREVSPRQTFRLAFHFGLFQALMPVAGWTLGLTVRGYIEQWDHWLAFGLLLYIGVRMMRDAFEETEENDDRCDPTRGLTLIMLAVATSIDALAVGLSLSVLGIDIVTPAIVIGVVCLLFTATGLHLGRMLSRAESLGRRAALAGGVVLIGIGLRILYEHGVFDTAATLARSVLG